jgi:hypothetical protein
MTRPPAHRRDFFGDLDNQPEKSERCQSSHERVSGEPSHGIGLVLSIGQARSHVSLEEIPAPEVSNCIESDGSTGLMAGCGSCCLSEQSEMPGLEAI